MRASPQQIAEQRTRRPRKASIPAPVGGLNTRDSIDAMDPTDALIMDNVFPEIGRVRARKGFAEFIGSIVASYGAPGPSGDEVETLISFKHGSNEKLICSQDGGIWRLDTGTAQSLQTWGTYTSDIWQHTIFTLSASPNTPLVYAVNGVDSPWTYDGTTFNAAWSPTVTGATLTDFVWINSFKNRVFMGEKGSRNFWYSGLGATATFTRFPLSGIRGAAGNILFMANLTRDTGSGPDDFAVFVTDTGSVIVYAGTDPASASTWELVGVYQIPRPIQSRHAYTQLFGDVVIVTEKDLIFLTEAMAGPVQPTKLTGALQAEAATTTAPEAWRLDYSPNDNMLIITVPISVTAGACQRRQYVVNTQTRAAARFTNVHAYCYATWSGKLYAGMYDGCARMWSGYVDDYANVGAAPGIGPTDTARIEIDVQQAWTDFGIHENKHITAVRPMTRTAGGMWEFGITLAADFVDDVPITVNSDGTVSDPIYWGDTSGVTTLWGDTPATTTYWAGTPSAGVEAAREWRLVSARGTDFSLRVRSSIQNLLPEWIATDYLIKPVALF